jgi:hypothetical protein
MRDEDKHIAMSPLDTVGEMPIVLQVLEIGLYSCNVKPHNGTRLRARVSVTGLPVVCMCGHLLSTVSQPLTPSNLPHIPDPILLLADGRRSASLGRGSC